jgi:hypothetical protein
VAKHDGAHLARHRIELLKHGNDEDCRLTHTGLGLAQDIHTKNRLRDAFVLHCAREKKQDVALNSPSVTRFVAN